jgi:hypothetical protein
MANELTVAAFLKFATGTKLAQFNKGPLQFTVSGGDYVQGSQTVATSEEALNKGDITTPGVCLIFNRDATNFVKVRGASGAVDCIKIKPGEFALFRHSGTAPFVIADTGSCEIEYLLIED